MNLRIPVKCSKKVEENGGFSMTFVLPDVEDRKDKILFYGTKEMVFITHNKDTAKEVNAGDILCLALFDK